MNYLEHLLVIAGEESSEIIKETTKALRFGMDSVAPGQLLTNEESIWKEANDLVAVLEMIQTVRNKGELSRTVIDAKKEKIKDYLTCSVRCGTLTL